MSYTAIYSPLISIPEDREGVKITDWHGFKERLKSKNETMLNKSIIKERSDKSTYPITTFKVLHGFKTYDRPETEMQRRESTSTLGANFNIERIGVFYDTEYFTQFWSMISEYTEPFWFTQPNPEHGVDEYGSDLLFDDVKIAYIECRNGDVDICIHKVGVKDITDITHSSN